MSSVVGSCHAWVRAGCFRELPQAGFTSHARKPLRTCERAPNLWYQDDFESYEPSSAGNPTAYPADASLPLVSIIYYAAGHTRANNGILPLASGAMLIRCSQPSGSVQLVLDVTGYLQ